VRRRNELDPAETEHLPAPDGVAGAPVHVAAAAEDDAMVVDGEAVARRRVGERHRFLLREPRREVGRDDEHADRGRCP
jgi:hypothetical protein